MTNDAGVTTQVNIAGKESQTYVLHLTTRRSYSIGWASLARVDPGMYSIYTTESLTDADYIYVGSRELVQYDHVNVNSWNGLITPSASLPLPSAPFASNFYNSSLSTNPVDGSQDTYFSILLNSYGQGTLKPGSALASDLTAVTRLCPESGCPQPPAAAADFRGRLFWSSASTWANTAYKPFPAAGMDVTVPYGWDLVLDTSPPALNHLIIEGNLTFSELADVNLTAAYIMVRYNGVLRVGGNGGASSLLNRSSSAAAPSSAVLAGIINGTCYPAGPSSGSASSSLQLDQTPYNRTAYILLTGTSTSKAWALSNTMSIGAKFLAATAGGSIVINGRSYLRRWTKARSHCSFFHIVHSRWPLSN